MIQPGISLGYDTLIHTVSCPTFGHPRPRSAVQMGGRAKCLLSEIAFDFTTGLQSSSQGLAFKLKEEQQTTTKSQRSTHFEGSYLQLDKKPTSTPPSRFLSFGLFSGWNLGQDARHTDSVYQETSFIRQRKLRTGLCFEIQYITLTGTSALASRLTEVQLKILSSSVDLLLFLGREREFYT
ncbi:hypothetical protein CC2G_013407 [Coprinopsis cinerea AmutBmut pab1-1]|nr:hypothetical protein CC2G_013407 [Coprinopsis cinerea AmutBmut pab1-1]